MDQSIREVVGDEAKMAVLQFLGQNLGEMKDLDKRLVNSNQTLRPVAGSIDPNAIVNSILQASPPQPPAPQPQVIQAPQAPAQVVIPSLESLNAVSAVSQPVAQQILSNDDQLELNFNESPYSEKIFDRLNNIENKLKSIVDTQCQILDIVSALKKKDQE